MIKQLQNPGIAGSAISLIPHSIGTVYYCDWTSGADANSGLTWASAFKTITKALTVATAYSTIYVKQGIYLEGATLAITQAGLKIIGVQTSGLTYGQPSIHTHGTETLMTINAHQVEIAFLSFHDQGAGTSLVIGNTAATWRTHIHDCFFGGNGTALYGIDAGNLNDAPFTVIEDCYFEAYVTAAIHQNAFNSTVRRNTFNIRTADTGIQYHPTGGDRPYGYILDNKFVTTDSTDSIGIDVEGTPTPGFLMISGNHFLNFATPEKACNVVGTTKTGLFGGGNFFNSEPLLMYPLKVTKTSTSHLTSGTLFNYKGTVEIISITGRVTTALEAATAQNCNLYAVPDALAETHLCAVLDIGTTALGVGSLITISGTLSDAMIATTVVGVAEAQAKSIVLTCVTSGVIGVTFGTSGSKDGAIVWEVLWIPISTGASLVAA
jgi:hypothetical protein